VIRLTFPPSRATAIRTIHIIDFVTFDLSYVYWLEAQRIASLAVRLRAVSRPEHLLQS
jgi:hypothetical protein